MHSLRTIATRSIAALVIVATVASALLMAILPARASAAACQSLGVDHGYVNSTVNIPETATYRVWSRLKTPQSDFTHTF